MLQKGFIQFLIPLLVGASLVVGFGVKYLVTNKTIDKEVELICEEVIKKETGVDINFDTSNEVLSKTEPSIDKSIAV